MPGERELNPSVGAYDRELVPWLFEPWAAPMVDLVAPEPSSRIVDLACGSGLIVRHLLGRLDDSGTVDAVDIDSAMLTYAAATLEDRRVSWHESDAARLPLVDSSVDRVSCHQGLQFFPDRSAALAEVRRVLEPGGRLAVATWGRLGDNPWPNALSRAVGQLLGEDAGAGMSMVCDLGEPVEVSELLREAGFEDVRVETHARTASHRDVRAAAEGQLSALPSGSAIDELSGEQQTELVELMCGLLDDHVDNAGRLSVKSTCNFARGLNPTEDPVRTIPRRA
jgi:ubiquinone/menaquinone biosynthesis C-methylase UbiE